MTDNARIVREALDAGGHKHRCGVEWAYACDCGAGPAIEAGYTALTALETDLATANADADRLATMCENQGREMIRRQGIIDDLHAELATAQSREADLTKALAEVTADLARAREEARKGPALEPITRHDVDRAVEDERERCAFAAYQWARESWGTPRFSLTDCRAALAPEQKDPKPPIFCDRGTMISQNLPDYLGIGLHVDHTLPPGTIEVWQNGKRIGRIENIGQLAPEQKG